MYYYDILQKLYEFRIKYLIIGGFAVNLHNVPRMTNDFDIIISTDKDNVKKITDCLSLCGYKTRIPVDPGNMSDPEIVKKWKTENNLQALSFYNIHDPSKEVDILLVHSLDFISVYKQREIRKLNGIEISLIDINNLIKLKQASGRKQDIADIILLRKMMRLKDER